MARLNGNEISQDRSWTEGWEETYNAGSEEELSAEINKLVLGLESIRQACKNHAFDNFAVGEDYQTQYDILQAMASHISYHLAEIIILRRIFGAWPPPSGGYVW